MLAQIIWFLLITILSFAIAIPVIKTMDERVLEPLELKAYVFSQIMKERYSRGKVIISNNGVKTLERSRMRRKEFDIEYISGGFIKYKMGFIRSAGTVYMKRGTVSFQPVTGKMVVKMK